MKRYLITGASRGIGRAIAVRLASKEITLLLHGRSLVDLQVTQELVEKKGANSEILLCDLSDRDLLIEMISKVSSYPLDLLVNNAGMAVAKPFESIELEEWERQISVNLTAPFLLTQRLTPHFSEGGSIVNILSVAAKKPFPGWSAYCASKFGLEGFTLSVREELRKHKIRLINIYPAATDTDIWETVEGVFPRDKMLSAVEVADSVAFALERPQSVLIESITVGNLGGDF